MSVEPVRAKAALRDAVIASVSPRLIAATMRTVYPRVEPELARLSEYMPRGGTAVDVGAWYGPWSRRMARYADRVVAIEAHPQLAQLLRDWGGVSQVVHAAASDSAGEAILRVPPGGPALGLSSVDTGGSSVGTGGSMVDSGGVLLTVPRISVDSLDLWDVRFIKLDVEGHELAALRGAAITIDRDRPLLLLELEDRMQDVNPVIDLLTEWGYHGYVQPGRAWIPLAEFDLVGHQRQAVRRVSQSLVRRLLWSRPRYVNMVLFRPDPTHD
jgi:FkbM family methyltransferase